MSRSSGSPKAGINVMTDFPHLGLHAAAATGNIGLAKYAISHGQPINSVINGVLPLHAACSGGHGLVVKLLIDNGADVNAPRLPRHNSEKHDPSAPIIGTLGSTPLHFAAANGHTQILLTLLRHGAPPDITDQRGITPGALAQQHGWNTCANIMNDWIANKDRDLLKYDKFLSTVSLDQPKPISQIPEHNAPLDSCEGPELLRRVTSLQDGAVSDHAWTPPESLNGDSLLAPSFRKPAGFITHSGFSLFDAQSTSNQSIVMSNFTHSSTYLSIEAIGNESSSYSAYHKLRLSQPVSVSSAQTKLSNVLHTEWNAIGISMMGLVDASLPRFEELDCIVHSDGATLDPGLLQPSGVVLGSESSRGGRENNTNAPRQGSQLDHNDSFSTTPMSLSVASEQLLSSSPLNAPSSLLSISAERTSSHKQSTGSVAVQVSGPGLGSGSGSNNSPLPPQPSLWDLQCEVNQANTRRQIRPKSYRVLNPEPRQPWMDDLPITSEEHMSSDSQQVLVVREGQDQTEYQLGNCSGGGQFKSVFRAFNLNTGQMVAVKRVELQGWREDAVERLMRKINLVKQLSHPSIIKYESITRDENMLNIVLEYTENGTLKETLEAFGKLNKKLVVSYAAKILDGLSYIHHNGVVYGDLRAANILTTKDGSVKLSNFGLGALEWAGLIAVGSPNWAAPEVLECKGMSTKSDIWSLGCTVIELLTGQPPYADMADDVAGVEHFLSPPRV